MYVLVYVTISMGNSGNGGLQTGGSPGTTPEAMTVGSIDTVDLLTFLNMSTVSCLVLIYLVIVRDRLDHWRNTIFVHIIWINR